MVSIQLELNKSEVVYGNISAMNKLPKISVNIPAKPNSDLTPVLNSLQKINYPKPLLEIIVATGNQIAKQRNKAIYHSKGEIIYLLDDDSEPKTNVFKIIAQEFADKKVAAVGGPSLTKKSKSYLNFLIGAALETYFGAMRMRLRYSHQPLDVEGNEYHLIGANLALRKSVVRRLGMFNEKIVPNEETELMRRIKKAGYRLIYNRKVIIHREHRKNLLDLARQFNHYGIGRMKQILYNGNPDDLIFLIPIFFVFYLISLFLFNNILYLAPLLAYLSISLITSLKAAVKYRKLSLIYTLPLLFPLIHTSYASGLIQEAVRHFILGGQILKTTYKIKIYKLQP